MKPVARPALPKWLLLLSLLVFLGAKQREKEKRVALVIGNGAYQAMTRLTNPPQDARDVGRKLESLGFEVTELENQSRAAMERAVEEFAKRSKGAQVAVLYYSGHGIQVGGRNYLIPVEAEPPDSEVGMRRRAVELEWVVEETTKAAKVSLIFMDACRTNPALEQRLPGTERDGSREVRLVAVPKGTVQVLYAASRGQKAADFVGTEDKKSRNSPFAEALLDHLGDRDSVQNVSTRIIGQVKRRTEYRQQPEQQGNLDELLYLVGKSAPAMCSTGMVLTDGACRPVTYKTCPPGLMFKEGVGCVADVVVGGKPAEVKTEPVVPQPSPVVAQPTDGGSESTLAESKYRPKMVPIPKGRFVMGSPKDEKGRDSDEMQHWVEITQPYLMMESEVTQGQYQAVMGANPSASRMLRFVSSADGEILNYGECKESGVSEDRPVYCVNFGDAVNYANRLSELEGLEECYRGWGTQVRWEKQQGCKGYRLPTEAEWEYAARAGDATVYAGSNQAEHVAWFGEDFSKSGTHPVKKKQPNQWGLYDLSGNVYEWVWDWYQKYGEKEQKDPVGPPMPSGGAASRVVRGGSWSRDIKDSRVAKRAEYLPGAHDHSVGIRLVRSYP